MTRIINFWKTPSVAAGSTVLLTMLIWAAIYFVGTVAIKASEYLLWVTQMASLATLVFSATRIYSSKEPVLKVLYWNTATFVLGALVLLLAN